jgi:NAD(P)-dependent dehydrogenase (short-subunit alcohol dehydrogenase family)
LAVEGKVAIVTGASRGIGRQLAIDLAARKMKVVIAARTVATRRRLPGTIGETQAAIAASGGEAIAVQTDLTSMTDLEALVTTTLDTFGRLDVLVNNAADTNGSNAPIEEYPPAKWRAEFDANVHAPFTLIAAAVPHMRAQGGGVIVNVTSAAGDLVDVAPDDARDSAIRTGTLLGYATTKAALNRMANALAPDLRADGIAIVNIDPGFTRTELVDLLGEQSLVDPEAAGSMSLTVELVARVLTSNDPMQFSGRILRSQP